MSTSIARFPLRIAVVTPPWYAIPPDGYGGIESMAYNLVERLLLRGHEVTLVAAGRNGTSARFLQTYPVPPSERCGQPVPEVVHALTAYEHLAGLELDVVHDHSLAGPLLWLGGGMPLVMTAHGPVGADLVEYYRRLSARGALVAISEAQRANGPQVAWAATIYNAIAVDEYPFEGEKQDYCLFLGRMSPEKAPDVAIEVARRAGLPLVIAAKCSEPAERRYFEERVRPLLGPDVEWFGHADTRAKKDLLAGARCLVFPIQWDEPFGIVMVEAMACGTPVVALRRGSVPEVVVDGVTGFVCERAEELAGAVERAGELDPKACRRRAVDVFDVADMAEAYEAVYLEQAARRPWAAH